MIRAVRSHIFPLVNAAIWFKLLRELALLSIFAITGAFVLNYFSPNRIPISGNWTMDSGRPNAGGPCIPRSIPRNKVLTYDDVVAVYLDPTYLVVDARSRQDYESGHIPGSISVPRNETAELLDSFLSSITVDQLIIVYCTGIDCDDSESMAGTLENLGYANVRVYSNGFDEWIERGGPTKSGPTP